MYSVILISFFLHCAIDRLSNMLNPLRKRYLESSKCSSEHVNKQLFMWRNKTTSLCYAVVSGVWSLLCFWADPRLSTDFIQSYTSFSLSLVEYSIGYFIMDSFSMYLGSKSRGTYEILVHHSVVTFCFCLSVFSKMYVGYAIVALLVEVNSVFLHLRWVLRYLDIPYHHWLCRLVIFLNIGTFIVFRFLVLSWMTRWLVINRDQISFLNYCIGAVSLATIMLMSIVLFGRLIYTDFLVNCTAAEAVSLVVSAQQMSHMMENFGTSSLTRESFQSDGTSMYRRSLADHEHPSFSEHALDI